jgi:hypothetical protein
MYVHSHTREYIGRAPAFLLSSLYSSALLLSLEWIGIGILLLLHRAENIYKEARLVLCSLRSTWGKRGLEPNKTTAKKRGSLKLFSPSMPSNRNIVIGATTLIASWNERVLFSVWNNVIVLLHNGVFWNAYTSKRNWSSKLSVRRKTQYYIFRTWQKHNILILSSFYRRIVVK